MTTRTLLMLSLFFPTSTYCDEIFNAPNGLYLFAIALLPLPLLSIFTSLCFVSVISWMKSIHHSRLYIFLIAHSFMKFSEWLKITHIQHFLHNFQCLGIFIQLNDSSVHKNVLTEPLSIKTCASEMKHCTWITGIERMQSSTKKRFPWTAIRSKLSFDGKKHFDWFNKWRNFWVLLCYCMNINYYTKKRKYRNELFIYKQ